MHRMCQPTKLSREAFPTYLINKTHLEIAKTWDVSGFLCQNVQSFSRAGRKSLQERFGIDEKIELERDCVGQKDDELQEERRGTADARTVGDKKQTGDVASRKSCQEFDFYHFDLNSVFVYDLHQQYRNRMAIYLFFLWGGQVLFFLGVLVLCFDCFSAFPATQLFCFSAFCSFCFVFFLLLCFSCFSVFLLLCFSCFSASLVFVFPVSLPFLFLCFSALCFCAFLLLLFYLFFLRSCDSFCCSTYCSSASLLPVFAVSVFFILFCFILSCLYPK